MSEQHLRPGPTGLPADDPVTGPDSDRRTVNPWERRSESGWLGAAWQTTRLFLLHPVAAFSATRPRGGFRGPLLFALIVTLVAGSLGEIVDAVARIPLEMDGSGNISDILDLKVNDERVPGAAWFPAAALGVAGLGGCLLGLVVGIPVFAVMFPLVMLLWTGVLHLYLKLTGGLRYSVSGFQGTWASVCYATPAFVPGMVPFIGDWLAFLGLGLLQGIGFWRLHRTSPARAAAALLLPVALVALLWLLKQTGVLPIEPRSL